MAAVGVRVLLLLCRRGGPLLLLIRFRTLALLNFNFALVLVVARERQTYLGNRPGHGLRIKLKCGDVQGSMHARSELTPKAVRPAGS